MSKGKNCNQKINCSVSSCEFNNCDCNECTLKSIEVSCDCGCQNNNVTEKSETICSSFKESKEKE